LKRVSAYSQRVLDTIDRRGGIFSSFEADYDYRDIIAMNIINIGETAAKLSDDFKSENMEIPWGKIKGMCDIMAHDYYNADLETIWEAATVHIPELMSFCNKILKSRG